jgi:hypothetical protein
MPQENEAFEASGAPGTIDWSAMSGPDGQLREPDDDFGPFPAHRPGAVRPPDTRPPGCDGSPPCGRCPTCADAREIDEESMSPADLLRSKLVTSAQLDDIPDPDPLVGDDILFRDSLAWMVGKPGCGKSFTALDLAGCVATGLSWHGHRVVDAGPVLYLVAEGVRGVKQRVRAWEKAMSQPMEGVVFLPVAVQAKNAGQWKALIEVAAAMRPFLIVVDTQARVTVGMEENSNSEMGEFVAQVERLRAASGACVLMVHHIGRNGETGRGATTIDGALSTVVRVTKDGDRVTLECTKNKDGAEWEPVNLRAIPFDGSVVLGEWTGSPGTGQASVRWLTEWWEIHKDEWISTGVVLKTVPVSESSFHRVKRALLDDGRLRRQGKGSATRYQVPSQPM